MSIVPLLFNEDYANPQPFHAAGLLLFRIHPPLQMVIPLVHSGTFLSRNTLIWTLSLLRVRQNFGESVPGEVRC